MYMTDKEILDSYRQAEDRRAQITVLADLNACKDSEMRDYLIALGEEAPPLRKRKAPATKKPPMDELRAKTLYDEGLDDTAIADALGEKETRVGEWRRRMRLPARRKKRSDCGGTERTEGETDSHVEPPALLGMTEEETDSHVGPEALLGMTKGEDDRISLKGLIRVLQDVEKGFPDAQIDMEGQGALLGASVRIDYDNEGQPAEVTVLLIGEVL